MNGVCPGAPRTPWWTGDGGVGDMMAALAGTDRDGALATVVPELMG